MLLTEFIELYPQFKDYQAIEESLYCGIKTIDEKYWFPFRWACVYDEIDLVQKFIELGTVLNFESNDYWTGLKNAICNGHIEIVKLLIQNGAEFYNDKDSCLKIVVKYKYIEVIKLLLKYYSPNYIIKQKWNKDINNEILVWYCNYIRKLKIVQRQCKHYLHKPGGPFFLNSLKQLFFYFYINKYEF